MVAVRYIAVILLIAGAAWAVEKKYYEYPNATSIKDDDRILAYQNISGSRNITGKQIKDLVSGGVDVSGKLDKGIFDNYTAKGRVINTDPRLSDARTPTAHDQAATTITYNATTVAAALDQLLYIPITISSYTLDGGSSITREIGSSYTVSTLAWITSKTPTTQTINSVARTSPYSVNSTITSTTTYTLYVADGALSNASSSRTVTFTHYRYYGVSPLSSLADADIIALSKEYSTSRSQTRSFTAAAEYLYIAYLATGGDATFTVNGFLDTSWVLVQRQFVNASGNSSEFRIYRSANPLTGTYSVVVS